MIKKIICWILGHKPSETYDEEYGDVFTSCERCGGKMADPHVVLPQDLPELPGPKMQPAAGDVKCSQCGAEWHSYHALTKPILCSDCREKK